MNYYSILNVSITSSPSDIKKQYHKLSLQYHPDKNNNETSQIFLEIKEAYDVLSCKVKRLQYTLSLIYPGFSELNLQESEYELINEYYEKLLNTNHYKLCSLVCSSLPPCIKESITSFIDTTLSSTKPVTSTYELYKSPKWIDISQLTNDETIHLYVNLFESYNDNLKTIYIKTRYGSIYYLFLRYFNNQIIIDNKDCNLYINIKTKHKSHFYRKEDDLYCLVPMIVDKEWFQLPDKSLVSIYKNIYPHKGFPRKYSKTRGSFFFVKYHSK